MKRDPIAHVRFHDGSAFVHPLDEHLWEAARLAWVFAAGFGNGDWWRAAGLWHDLGKYKNDFQEYIRLVRGFERDEAEKRGAGCGISLTAGERIIQSNRKVSNSLLEISAFIHALPSEHP